MKYMQFNHCVEKLNVVCSHFLSIATTITEAPVSVTALIGTNAQFHCAGIGNILVWEVDGLQIGSSGILSCGSSGKVQSNLTVPATLANNNIL